MVQRTQKKALKLTNFKNEIHPCESLVTEAKVLILTYIITLNNCMLVFHHLNSSLPAIFHNNIVTTSVEQGDMS